MLERVAFTDIHAQVTIDINSVFGTAASFGISVTGSDPGVKLGPRRLASNHTANFSTYLSGIDSYVTRCGAQLSGTMSAICLTSRCSASVVRSIGDDGSCRKFFTSGGNSG